MWGKVRVNLMFSFYATELRAFVCSLQRILNHSPRNFYQREHVQLIQTLNNYHFGGQKWFCSSKKMSICWEWDPLIYLPRKVKRAIQKLLYLYKEGHTELDEGCHQNWNPPWCYGWDELLKKKYHLYILHTLPSEKSTYY